MIPYYDNNTDAPKVINVPIDNPMAPYLKQAEGILRPHSRYYYLEQGMDKLVAPPQESDGRWIAVYQFLYGDPADRPESVADDFEARVFRDLSPEVPAEQGGDQESLGAWSVKYRTDYYGGSRLNPIYHEVPDFLRVGDIPWAAGIDNAGHYDVALSLLRCYLRNRRIRPRLAGLAWQFYAKRCLYEAGQIVNHKTGSWRYEKSKGPWPGDFQPADRVMWSHSFPNGLLLFIHLTGQMEDVGVKIAEHMQETFIDATLNKYQATYSTGHYGPRRCAWYLRALRCAGAILGEAVQEDDHAASVSISSVLRWTNKTLRPQWIRQKQAEAAHAPIGAWDTWAWIGEALPWAVMHGRDDIVREMGSIARWMSRWNAAGQVPYTIKIVSEDNVTPKHTSSTHTAVALPAIAGLVAAGELDERVFRDSFRFWMQNLPYGCRGQVSSSNPKQRDLAHGAAAPKIMATHAMALVNPVFDLAKRMELI